MIRFSLLIISSFLASPTPKESKTPKTEPAKSVAEPTKQKTKAEEPKSIPVSTAGTNSTNFMCTVVVYQI